MTEVLFVSSVQGYQGNRIAELTERLRKDRPDLAVRIASPEESGALLAEYKLKFGPAIVIGGRLEFVGIPRYRILVERIQTAIERAKAPPPPPAPAASPAKPAAPAPETAPPSG